MTSSRIPCPVHRQMGAPFVESTSKPRSRSRVSSSRYSAADPISARVSTSRVARTGGAAESVISNAVAHPPRKTSSSHSGPSACAAISMISRFGFCVLAILAKPLLQLPLRSLFLSCSTGSQCIHDDKKLIELGIVSGCLWRRFVDGCERLTSHITRWVWPHDGFVAVHEQSGQRRCTGQRRHPSTLCTSLGNKEVSYAVIQELFEVSNVYTHLAVGFVSQFRSDRSLDCRVDLRCTHAQINCQ